MTAKENELVQRLRDAVVALKDIRSQRDALLQEKNEPIAIIGIACRFPGPANSPEEFFDLLLNRSDTITAVPPERWTIPSYIDQDPTLQGARWGAFIKDVASFDPSFFGVSPREAEKLDPQQRLLLEVTWEAMERAGLIPQTLVGTKTGIFLGIMNADYFAMNLALPREQQDAYSATGNGHCFPAGRLAYTFGFEGPAFAIDTACSSSLVATHLGCQSLRIKESEMAIVGGVNLMLDPLTSELTAKTGALAADGRCKSFDSRANGYVRGEGCGVVVLKRLADARRDGNPIIAIIRGSAINQDGRSTGLTTPNVLSQQTMLEQALANAQLSAGDIGYIEAHGTGTPLGDPIEMEALRTVFGRPRPDGTPCVVGTLKTNIGHLEAAAGIAGLIKAALVLEHGKIPPNLHLRHLNPRISLEGTPLVIADGIRPLIRGDKPSRAGVSSFGMSGTNAHVILESAPPIDSPKYVAQRSAYLVPVSAKTPEALKANASSVADWLSAAVDASMPDVVHTAGAGRTHHDLRLAAIGRNRDELVRSLRGFSTDGAVDGMIRGSVLPQHPPQIVFVFSGQGSQWAGMGASLLTTEPIFRAKLEEIDTLVQRYASFSLLHELSAPQDQSRLKETEIVQPSLFALQVGLVELLASWGIRPSAVIGHSIGEIAAAQVSGALPLDAAVQLAVLRGRIMQKATGRGRMVWAALHPQAADKAISARRNTVAIAAINDPTSVVFSGQTDDVEALVAELNEQNVATRWLNVNYAFHSPQMDPLARELITEIKSLELRQGALAMYSTVTGTQTDARTLQADYWGRNMRSTVDLAAAMHSTLQDGYRIFLEIGPHPVLTANIQQCVTTVNADARVIPTLKRQSDEHRSLMESVGAAYVAGVHIDWKRLANGTHLPAYPTYPWQRRRYWIENKHRPVQPPLPEPSTEDWLYSTEWHLSPLKTSIREPADQGPWLIFMDQGRIGKNIILNFRSRGVSCVRVDFGDTFKKHSPTQYTVHAGDRDCYTRVLRDVIDTHHHCSGILVLSNLNATRFDDTTVEGLDTARHDGVVTALHIAQALLRNPFPNTPRLWLISQGAVATRQDSEVQSIAQAPMWGFGRTVMMEHPELRCTCIDLDHTTKFDTVTSLVRTLEADEDDDLVALRAQGRFVGRLVRARIESETRRELVIRADATYLISGGTGGLGIYVAEWLVTRGAMHLVLLARRPATGAAMETISRLKSKGATIRVIQGDIAQANDVLQALCTIEAEMPQLKGIIHAAGVVDDRTLLELSEKQIEAVFAPKVSGAWNLHMFSANLNLDFFVLYSSAAALFGSPGQANYAAANAFLDALAHARRARGLPALSIQWGPFSEKGMAAVGHDRGNRLHSRGIESLSPYNGVTILERLLEQAPAEIGVIRMDVSQWLDSNPQLTKRSFWSLLAAQDLRNPNIATSKTHDVPIEPGFNDSLASGTPQERTNLLETRVRAELGKVLRMDPAKIAGQEKFHAYGLDSLMAIELRNRLQTIPNVKISTTDLFTHGSVNEIVALIARTLNIEAQPQSLEERTVQRSSQPMEDFSNAETANGWLVIFEPRPEARLRLICFPYAGGNATLFSSWARAMPAEIELCAIQPPGRMSRSKESFSRSVDEMVESLTPQLIPYLDKPFAMFGHCLGAIVMYEVVKKLAAEFWLYPIQLIASGAPAPRRYLLPNLTDRSDEDLVQLLSAIGLTQQQLLDDREAMVSLLPVIRADFSVASSYAYRNAIPGNAPILAFAGIADVFASPTLVDEWREETTSYHSLCVYPEGHYFLLPERDSMLRIITMEVMSRLASDPKNLLERDPIRWRVRRTSSPTSAERLRIVCFHGLAGGTEDFSAWDPMLPDNVELCVVELPGHEQHSKHTPLSRIEEMADYAAAHLARLPEQQCLYVGHNLGALVMLETAQRLERAKNPPPDSFFVLGAMAPMLHYFSPIHQLPDEQLIAALRLFGLSVDPAKISISVVRADCAALANYDATRLSILNKPMTVIAGARDQFIAPTSIASWKKHTKRNAWIQTIPCTHRELLSNPEVFAILHTHIRTMTTTQ